jgi:two-component system, NarL family, captular synthesis response regulator RcsB
MIDGIGQVETQITMGSTAGLLQPSKTVLVCDSRPVTAEGVRALVSAEADLRSADSVDSLAGALGAILKNPIDVLLIDNVFGTGVICEWLASLRVGQARVPAIVVWGTGMSATEEIWLLYAGVSGILRKTADLPVVVSCLRAIVLGRVWIADRALTLRETERIRAMATREERVSELIQKGLKNQEIARRSKFGRGQSMLIFGPTNAGGAQRASSVLRGLPRST